MEDEMIHIDVKQVKERIRDMRPNADMNKMHYAFFEGYINALKWILDE